MKLAGSPRIAQAFWMGVLRPDSVMITPVDADHAVIPFPPVPSWKSAAAPKDSRSRTIDQPTRISRIMPSKGIIRLRLHWTTRSHLLRSRIIPEWVNLERQPIRQSCFVADIPHADGDCRGTVAAVSGGYRATARDRPHGSGAVPVPALGILQPQELRARLALSGVLARATVNACDKSSRPGA